MKSNPRLIDLSLLQLLIATSQANSYDSAHYQNVKVIDTSKENLYRVPTVQDWSRLGVYRSLDQVPSLRKEKLKMGSIKGGEPTKKPKKKTAAKKTAKKKAAKK